ncbi:hypothetical protein P885DRAFT_75825 [Corynascus similis CBS 632.67]
MREPPRSDPGFRNRKRHGPEADVDSSTEEGTEIMRSYGNITASLYDKARDHQDKLTEVECQLFLSRGDVLGKALVYPDSLTTDEIHGHSIREPRRPGPVNKRLR